MIERSLEIVFIFTDGILTSPFALANARDNSSCTDSKISCASKEFSFTRFLIFTPDFPTRPKIADNRKLKIV